VQILRDAMRKTFADPEFPKQYQKLTGDEVLPLMPEAVEKSIRDCRASLRWSTCSTSSPAQTLSPPVKLE
jgi:hypothetical protein